MALIADSLRREILRRAEVQRQVSRLKVDFYRVRHKLFLPLPVTEFPEKLSVVRGLPNYPFAIWVLWELEERIFVLGQAAEWNGETDSVARDLEALAGWKRFRQRNHPDLCSAHIARIFVRALEWTWLSNALRKKMVSALRRLVDDGLPLLPDLAAPSASELVEQGVRFSNIPTIGALGLSLAAMRCRHPGAKDAQARAELMAELWLSWGDLGQIEGVSYDGYTADFFMDWLAGCSASLRRELLMRPRLLKILDEIQYLGAPGRPENFALLGDVEPFEMRFHYSFAAKFLHHGGVRARFAFPAGAEKFLRGDALPFLSASKARPSTTRGFCDAHYALVLNAAPVRAAVSWSHSQFGHMQADWGSVVIAVGGEWLISDAGYRQYLDTSERIFTVGATAHNIPVINGEAASVRLATRAYEILEGCGVRLDLGQTFARWHGACFREIHVERGGRVVVEDRFSGGAISRLDYHWHGHPQAAWHIAGGWAFVHGDMGLRFTCDGHPPQTDELQRLKGSRGNLTLVKTLNFAKPKKNLRLRWIFEPVGP